MHVLITQAGPNLMECWGIWGIIGCEESQAITIEFRKAGKKVISCDLKPATGGYPQWHWQGDIFEAIERFKPKFAIIHPPCTFVASSSTQWLSHPEDKHLPWADRRPNPRYPNRRQDMLNAVEFVKKLWACDIPQMVIENPIGLLSTHWMKPTQIIHPWQFGHEAEKATCLWIRGLPTLKPTNIVGKGERFVFKSGKSMPKWYYDAKNTERTKGGVQTLRSKTFEGMAAAMAQQWGGTHTGADLPDKIEFKPNQLTIF